MAVAILSFISTLPLSLCLQAEEEEEVSAAEETPESKSTKGHQQAVKGLAGALCRLPFTKMHNISYQQRFHEHFHVFTSSSIRLHFAFLHRHISHHSKCHARHTAVISQAPELTWLGGFRQTTPFARSSVKQTRCGVRPLTHRRLRDLMSILSANCRYAT